MIAAIADGQVKLYTRAGNDWTARFGKIAADVLFLSRPEVGELAGGHRAISCTSGTAALHLCAMALGVNKSSRVITTPITFVASANCVRY